MRPIILWGLLHLGLVAAYPRGHETRFACGGVIRNPNEATGEPNDKPSSSPQPQRLERSLTRERTERLPFKVLFLLPNSTNIKNRQKLQPIFDLVNSRLSKILEGPPLTEVRFDNEDNCWLVKYDNAVIDDEFIMPRGNKTVAKPSIQVQQLNQENYTIVAYVLIRDDTFFGESCTASHLAVACICESNPITKRHIRGLIIFCKQPYEMDDKYLEAVVLHEVLHIVTDDLIGTQVPSSACSDVTTCKYTRLFLLRAMMYSRHRLIAEPRDQKLSCISGLCL